MDKKTFMITLFCKKFPNLKKKKQNQKRQTWFKKLDFLKYKTMKESNPS